MRLPCFKAHLSLRTNNCKALKVIHDKVIALIVARCVALSQPSRVGGV